jgi:hypothetical protein
MSESAKKRRPKTRPLRAEPVRERGAEVVRPRHKAEGRSEKSPGLVVNKAAEIRRTASLLVSQGELPRPSTIRERLKRKGIVVTSQQVSMALSNTEFAYRRNQIDQGRPPVLFPDPALALRQVSIEDVMEARKFVEKLGGIEKAMAALVAFRQFGGEQATATELTKSQTATDGNSPETARAAMRLTS